MKIVFIIDQVFKHGGIERVLSIKSNYLSSVKNHNIFILTTEQGNNKYRYHFDSEIIFDDLNINYKKTLSYFHPINLFKIPRHIFKLQRSLKRIKPNIIVVCSHNSDTYFIPFLKRNIPKVKEFHYSKFIEKSKRSNASFFKKVFFKFTDYVETKYDKLVVLNKDESSYYKSNNTITIPNPLTFYPKLISKLNSNIVISAGRIAEVKRFDLLIDIWDLVHKKNKNYELHIYGTGNKNYINALQDKIKNKNLADTVYFKGPTNEVENKLINSSLFVMTSSNECFPLVLLEAQACGLPIISFDCPHGPRNIIDNNNGYLIEMSDIHSFSDTILHILSNESKRKDLGRNARKNSAKYTVDKVINEWEKMFLELINEL